MKHIFRKTLAVCLIGLGLGILLVLLLPLTGWLFIIGWVYVACMLIKRREIHMTVVVKKVPKFLRGFVKLIFGIKD